jgi:hypothetical protein
MTAPAPLARATPLVAPDRIEPTADTESGADAAARKRVRADDPYLVGHHPDSTLYPAVFLLESVSQAVEEPARRLGGWPDGSLVPAMARTWCDRPGPAIGSSSRRAPSPRRCVESQRSPKHRLRTDSASGARRN